MGWKTKGLSNKTKNHKTAQSTVKKNQADSCHSTHTEASRQTLAITEKTLITHNHIHSFKFNLIFIIFF